MRKLLLITFWIFFPPRLLAQAKPEFVPPVPLEAREIVNIQPYHPYDRPPAVGQRNVWELLAPDYTGRFRPRVILAPAGAYYLSNGRPYPWTTTNSLPLMPYAD